jgi:hypothetical protein
MKSLALLSFCGFFIFQLSSCKKDYTEIYSEKIEFKWVQIEPICLSQYCMTITFNDNGTISSNISYLDGDSYSFKDENHIEIDGKEYECEFKDNDTQFLIKSFIESLIGEKNEDALLQK